jgi:hypothetical protein
MQEVLDSGNMTDAKWREYQKQGSAIFREARQWRDMGALLDKMQVALDHGEMPDARWLRFLEQGLDIYRGEEVQR